MAAVNPSIPLSPPSDWFTPPATMSKDAGCVVEPDGRIYGYLCHWGGILMDGTSDRWKAPRSKTGYAYAHTGDTVCADGSVLKTANLGGDAGHARVPSDEPARVESLQLFYENTQTQLARIRYGEDEHGVWFAGACWPTVTDLDIAKLRASARSGHWAAIGDWRDMQSGRAGYELVGACLVNVPGLKYARADRAASGVLTLRPVQMDSGDTQMVFNPDQARDARGRWIGSGGLPNGAHIPADFTGTYKGPLFHGTSASAAEAIEKDGVFQPSSYGNGSQEWNFGTTFDRTSNYEQGGLVVVDDAEIRVGSVRRIREIHEEELAQYRLDTKAVRELHGRDSPEYDAMREAEDSAVAQRVSKRFAEEGFDGYVQGEDTLIVTNPGAVQGWSVVYTGSDKPDSAASGVLTLRPVQLDSGADVEGAMVALFVDPATAKALAVEGGEPAEQLHITLAYFEEGGADRDDWDAIHTLVRNVGARHLPLAGTIGGQGIFRPGDGEVHWASPDIPGLSELRNDLVAAVELAGFDVRKDHGFTPHITLRYADAGEDPPLVESQDIAFDRLTLAVGGDMTSLATRTETKVERIAASGTVALAAESGTAEVAVGGVLVLEDHPTEDGRLIQAGAIEWRETPLPLYAKLENTEGHTDAQLVGRIDAIWRDDADPNRVMYAGTITPDAASDYGQRVLDAIEAQMLRGVSVDGIAGPDDIFFNEEEVMVFTRMVIGGATLTPMPAINEATVTIGEEAVPEEFTVANPKLECCDDDETKLVEGEVEEVAEEQQDDDQWAALTQQVAAVGERLEFLIELIQASSMSARYDAAVRRLEASE